MRGPSSLGAYASTTRAPEKPKTQARKRRAWTEFGGWLAAKLSPDGHTVWLTDTVAPAWTSRNTVAVYKTASKTGRVKKPAVA